MNYYTITRAAGVAHDSRGFFATEQIAATATLLCMALIVWNGRAWFGWDGGRPEAFRDAISIPDLSAILAGVPFGIVAFFSVFIFLFKGRTATFVGLVNRLTSLLAGVTATLVFATWFGGTFPTGRHWGSVGLIVVAVYFLTRAERRRAAELASTA
jgi:drug/metabolite transporter (DMT)-like permease